MALPFYLTLEGKSQGPIVGSSATIGHEDQIQCHALEQTIDRPINIQTGQPTGLRLHHPLKITKSFDKSSPPMYQALVNGEKMTEVKLEFYRILSEGQEELYFTITLTDALIVSIKPRMHNVFDEDLVRYDHMEEVSFLYGQISWRWEPDGIESMDVAIAPGA